ncbi:MAG: 5-oxoprolinase subunit PxpB [Luteitalea sp.]
MTGEWRMTLLGDAAVRVECLVGEPFAANARIHACAAHVRHAAVAGVRDVVPGMRDLVVHVDPLRCDLAHLNAVVAAATTAPLGSSAAPIVHEVPVRYGGDGGPDLADVAAARGLSEQELCRRHSAPTYTVCFVGFMPGFAYLGPIDATLRGPRRLEPRPAVPAGSVAIGGEYTGIYPSVSPGGWHIIGHTDLGLFDLSSAAPARLTPGARVRFVTHPHEK